MPVAPTTTVLTASLSADTGTSSTDFITSAAAQTVSGTLSANLAAGEKVEVSYDNGGTWSDATSYTLGSSTWSSTTTLAGSNVFQARVSNSTGSSTPLTQSYVLDAGTYAPTVANGTVYVTEDAGAVVTGAGSVLGGAYRFGWSDFGVADADAVANLSIKIMSVPISGTLEFYNGSTWNAVVAGTTTLTSSAIGSGHLRFVPAANESGDSSFASAGVGNRRNDYATFTFVAVDGSGLTSATGATMTVDVKPVADAPVSSVTNFSSTPRFTTSWEAADTGVTQFTLNPDTTATAYASAATLAGWTRVDTPDPFPGGTNVFKIWSSSDLLAAQNGTSYAASPAAGNGVNWLELANADNAGALFQTLGISRNVTTTAGRVYELSLSYAGRLGFSNDFTLISVYVDGVKLASYSNLSPQDALNWQQAKFSFVGSGGSQQIKIVTEALQYSSSGRGAMVDVITLVEHQGVLAGNAASGTKTEIALASYISAALSDTDGSESLSYSFSSLPVGATIVTTASPSGIAAVAGSVAVSAADVASAKLQLPASALGNFSVSVTATATDADGSTRTSAPQTFNFRVTGGMGADGYSYLFGDVNPNAINGTTGADSIAAGAGNDSVSANSGNDLIVGGAGSDSLTGGGGADTFVWAANDNGTNAAQAVDTISDFSTATYASGGDRIDLSTLLVGASTATLDKFVHFRWDGTNTTAFISTTGAFTAGHAVGGTFTDVTNNSVQQIVFSGVNLTSGFTTDLQVLNDLISKGKLVIDSAVVVPPPAPTTTVLSAALSADTGASTTDFITRTAAQTISGTLSANLASGEKVEVSFNNGSTWIDATSFASGSNTWSANATLAASGVLQVRVSNSTGSSTAFTQAYVLDTTAPTFLPATSTPADDATAFGIGNDVVAKFGERIDASSDLSKVYLKDAATNTLVPGVVSINVDGNVVINPSGNLNYSTAYYVSWDANALKDTAGNAVAAVANSSTFNFTAEAAPPPPPDPEPAPPTPVVVVVDGTTVTTTSTTTTASNGQSINLTTQTVAPVPQGSGGSNGRADIPLATDPSGNPLVQVSLPPSVGLLVSSFNGNGLTADTQVNTAVLNRVNGGSTGTPGPLNQALITAAGAGLQDAFGTPPPADLVVRSIALTVAGTAPPSQPIQISGSRGNEVLVIDVSALPPGTVLNLNNVRFAVIVGSTTLTGGDGRNVVVADGARQFMVLGAGDDELHAGGGDDTVGSKGGDDKLWGDAGNDKIVGGIGNDQLYGGDGNDILQGGPSDAGRWGVKLDAQGQLHIRFVPDNTELADSTGLSLSGNWSTPSGQGLITDSRLSFAYQNYSLVQDVALLIHGLTGRLPTLSELSAFAKAGFSSAQLAAAAHQSHVHNSGPQPQAIEAQVQSIIARVMGGAFASSDTAAQWVVAGSTFIAQGGSWANLWLAVVRSDAHKAQLPGATPDGMTSLVYNQSLAETGWSGQAGNNQLYGDAGNDVLIGGSGNNLLDGGTGTDMAVFFGAVSDFEISRSSASTNPADLLLRHKATGAINTLRNVEYLRVGEEVYATPQATALVVGRYVDLSTQLPPAGVTLQGIAFHSDWLV